MAKLATMFIAVLAFFATLTSVGAASAFSDDDAKAFFEHEWNASTLASPLGDFTSPKSSVATGLPRALSAAELQTVTALAQAGFLIVTQRQQKDAVVLSIAVTPAGSAINQSTSKDQFRIPLGQFTINKILKNDPYTNLIDDYRVVMVTVAVAWSNPYLQYISAVGGITLQSARKAILLVKLDPFAGKWEFVVGDFANATDPFTTAQVMSVIRQFH